MSLHPQFLDIDNWAEKVRKIKGDPYFVEFLIARNGLRHTDTYDFMTKKFSQAELRRWKRYTQKTHGEKWEKYWDIFYEDHIDLLMKMKVEKGFFSLDSVPQKPRHRPRNCSLWMTVFDLQNYFIKISNDPNIRLIQDMLSPTCSNFSRDWNRWRELFQKLIEELPGINPLGTNNEISAELNRRLSTNKNQKMETYPIIYFDEEIARQDTDESPFKKVGEIKEGKKPKSTGFKLDEWWRLRIDLLLRWYQFNQDKIKKALDTGIPVYEKFMTKVS